MKFTNIVLVCVVIVVLYPSSVPGELCDVYNVSIYRNNQNRCTLKIRCLDGRIPVLGACIPEIESLTATKC